MQDSIYDMEEKNREKLVELGLEESIVFTEPSFDRAIIGTDVEGRVVYSYDLMVAQLAEDEGIDPEEAAEFIDYNTVRSLPYTEGAPVIVYNMGEFLDSWNIGKHLDD